MRSPSRFDRSTGSLMAELMIAMTVLTVGVLSFVGAFHSNARAYAFVNAYDEASLALESAAELLRGQDFADLYSNYEGATIDVPALSYGGQTAVVDVDCHVNETNIPAVFGPLTDLDGNASQQSTDVSGSYQLLPVRLKIDFDTGEGAQTRELYIVLGGGTN